METSPQPQPAPVQPALLEVPESSPPPRPALPERRWPRAPLDEWKEWSIWRRLLRDKLVPDAGFKLWHHYHDHKDRFGYVRGNWADGTRPADADWIAREYGWKRRTVYRLNTILANLGWIEVASEGRNHSTTIRVLNGLGVSAMKVRQQKAQGELAIAVPYVSPPAPLRCAPEGTANGLRCAPKGTAKQPLIIDSKRSICKEGSNEQAPPRELWQIEKDLKGVRELSERIRLNQPRSEQRKEMLGRLRARERALELEYVGLPEESEPDEEPRPAPLPVSPGHSSSQQLAQIQASAPDPPGPMPGQRGYQEWKDQYLR
jgi:hypothetical protein